MAVTYKPLQHDAEIAKFIDILKVENVRSYLEIGSRWGGSLWQIANSLPAGSLVVSVDLPQSNGDSRTHLSGCISELKTRGYDARVFFGNSADEEIVRQVADIGRFDAVFIDGGHSLDAITADWENYGPICRLVAFHDIAWKQQVPSRGYQIDAPKFWESIKSGRKYQEIKLDPTGEDNGIGILWNE